MEVVATGGWEDPTALHVTPGGEHEQVYHRQIVRRVWTEPTPQGIRSLTSLNHLVHHLVETASHWSFHVPLSVLCANDGH